MKFILEVNFIEFVLLGIQLAKQTKCFTNYSQPLFKDITEAETRYINFNIDSSFISDII